MKKLILFAAVAATLGTLFSCSTVDPKEYEGEWCTLDAPYSSFTDSTYILETKLTFAPENKLTENETYYFADSTAVYISYEGTWKVEETEDGEPMLVRQYDINSLKLTSRPADAIEYMPELKPSTEKRLVALNEVVDSCATEGSLWGQTMKKDNGNLILDGTAVVTYTTADKLQQLYPDFYNKIQPLK